MYWDYDGVLYLTFLSDHSSVLYQEILMTIAVGCIDNFFVILAVSCTRQSLWCTSDIMCQTIIMTIAVSSTKQSL